MLHIIRKLLQYLRINIEARWFSSKALREQMQSFALADAKLCVSGCKALHGRMQSFASEMIKTGCSNRLTFLDKRKGWNDSPYVAQQPFRIYLLTPKNWFWGEMYQTERARTLSD